MEDLKEVTTLPILVPQPETREAPPKQTKASPGGSKTDRPWAWAIWLIGSTFLYISAIVMQYYEVDLAQKDAPFEA